MAPRHPLHPRLGLIALMAAAAGLLGTVGPLRSAHAGNEIEGPGGKGAQVYCFMRNNGNVHEVSWTAAYALIKRQSAGVFKTSPEHAAVMITEAVVQNPGTYPDCGRFLGDLYAPRPSGGSAASPQASPTSISVVGGGSAGGSGMTRSERYN
ncbi:MAG: penicillin amidase [Cyanobium sp. CACIAM 14]|nr:MAG: penicillin amidase [Cyanobium sp. CACIAM 14]